VFDVIIPLSIFALLILLFKVKVDHTIKIAIFLIIFLENLSNFIVFQRKIFWGQSLFFIILTGFMLLHTLVHQKRDDRGIFLDNSFIRYFTFDGTILHYSVFFGILIAFVTFLTEYLFFDGKGLYEGDRDIPSVNSNMSICLLISSCWITYNSVPQKYNYERDFIFLFAHSLFIFFVLPSLLIGFYTDSLGLKSSTIFEEFVVYNFLGKPLASLLSLLGQTVWAQGISIYYVDSTTGLTTAVIITTGCSGLNSVLIFLCAYVTFILCMVKKPSIYNTLIFLLLGLYIAYLANLLRMAIVVLAGHYWGTDALEFTHANIGWLIFTLWFGSFMLLIDRIFPFSNDNMRAPLPKQ